MRKVITIENRPFTFDDEVKKEILEIITLYDSYLEEYPTQGTSKHAIMGPIGKILQRAQTGQWLTDSLTGYALRVHEMHLKTGSYVRPEAVQKLEMGTKKLSEFLKNIPIIAVPKVIEQIDYGLYYERQLKNIISRTERLENMKKELSTFLHAKYSTDEDFAQAWNDERFSKMDDLPYYFGPNSLTYKKSKGKMKSDIDEFYKLLANKGQRPEAEEVME